MIKAVLWDLDGTLVDSAEFHWRAWRDVMAEEGSRPAESGSGGAGPGPLTTQNRGFPYRGCALRTENGRRGRAGRRRRPKGWVTSG